MAHPLAEQFVRAALEDALSRAPGGAALQERVLGSCAVRLRDMIDHVAVAPGERGHEAAGWRQDGKSLWSHPSGLFPRVIERADRALALRVERIERFLQAHQLDTTVFGPNHGPLRRARLFDAASVALDVVERNGSGDFVVPSLRAPTLRRAGIHQQVFRTRRRHFRSVESGFAHTERLVEAAVADLGPLWACDLFLRAEREHWLSHCEAAVLQKRRQDRAGVGWCTLDHVVYCSSRQHFHRAAALFGKLGYAPRGFVRSDKNVEWGGRIFEHESGLQPAVLIEVDLAGEPGDGPLDPLTWHGRAGLWCAMHGESLLEGGPCRFAARYDLDALQQLVERDGVGLAAPFPDAPHLRQRIAPGQLQAVNPLRVDGLERAGYLSRTDAETLRLNGAIATHLQAVERADAGFAAPDYADEVFGGGYGTPGAVPALSPKSRRTPVRLKRRRSMRQ